jgi:hypothetical protein
MAPVGPAARRRHALLLLAACLAPPGLAACGMMSEAELRCAEAAARLTTCCPGFQSAPVSCESSSGPVAISLDEAHCIEDRSCDALATSGVCARALDRLDGVPSGQTFTSLCP